MVSLEEYLKYHQPEEYRKLTEKDRLKEFFVELERRLNPVCKILRNVRSAVLG